MNFEEEIFNKMKINYDLLVKYGFVKQNNLYKFSKLFMNDTFKAEITIDDKGKIIGKVIDMEFEDEYTNFRVEEQVGEFVGQVREEYKNILMDIANSCCEKQYFSKDQSNRISELIFNKYGDSPEFLWEKDKGSGVFRNPKSKKWYVLIMDIDKSKIDEGTGEVEILNIKLNEELVKKLLKEKGFYEAYHMKKSDWITILLDNTVDDAKIMELIEISHMNTANRTNDKQEWIIPANPKYYDVINAFNNADIITWKQSNNILAGDIVYLYVASPISAILYKCEVLEVDIPYEYKDSNLHIKKVMKIKLLKRYDKEQFTFDKLNEYGIRAIRGPRGLPKELSKELNK